MLTPEDGCEYNFLLGSGLSHKDCWLLGYRYEYENFSIHELESWAIRVGPMGNPPQDLGVTLDFGQGAWWTGVWYSPSGVVFVADSDGKIRTHAGAELTGPAGWTDEFWAVTEHGKLLEGSAHGWALRAQSDFALLDVTKFKDEIWIAAGAEGLLRFEKGTDRIAMVEPEIHAKAFDSRGDLVVVCHNLVAGSSDGRAFRAAAIDKFQAIRQGQPKLWEG